ncbi:hypothetical protein EDB82DRAFT_66949 [Fusarium venenatum]|uniref:uncharacterized protein n=1 Tax=Fusarium venenatum TaxID=56646 RepID=UPI001D1B6F35|nr:hypothetical protein EDB82DRAFT_66949 [Fusarium venenatum]
MFLALLLRGGVALEAISQSVNQSISQSVNDKKGESKLSDCRELSGRRTSRLCHDFLIWNNVPPFSPCVDHRNQVTKAVSVELTTKLVSLMHKSMVSVRGVLESEKTQFRGDATRRREKTNKTTAWQGFITVLELYRHIELHRVCTLTTPYLRVSRGRIKGNGRPIGVCIELSGSVLRTTWDVP